MSRNHLYLCLFPFLRIIGNKFVRVHLLKEKDVLHDFFFLFKWLSSVKLNTIEGKSYRYTCNRFFIDVNRRKRL